MPMRATPLCDCTPIPPVPILALEVGPDAAPCRVLLFLRSIDTLGEPMAVLLFCQCGSDRVDVRLWNGRRAQLQCFSCGQEAWLEGFTVSEFDPAKLLTAAVVDQARKHRKRPAEDVERIQEHRKARSR